MANKKVTPLTDTEVKTAKPKEKKDTLPDGKKIWEIRYTVNGNPKATTAGIYPAVSLKDARAKRDELKAKVSTGIDPIKEKQELKEQSLPS